jgi:hypothetical protein
MYPADIVWGKPGKTVLPRRTVNGLTNLCKYSVDGRALTQISSGPGPDFSLMLSPATTGIYYVNGKASAFLTAYRVRSKEPADIVSENVFRHITSQDGKRVMYIKLLGPDHTQLWVSDIDGINKLK